MNSVKALTALYGIMIQSRVVQSVGSIYHSSHSGRNMLFHRLNALKGIFEQARLAGFVTHR